MSIRRFNVLLHNLSSESVTRLRMQYDEEKHPDTNKKEMKTLTQDEFVALLGT